jgi:prolipoprotein diacylglyceryl transferase
MASLAFIPSPSSNGFNVGPLFVHYYGLCYVVGITVAVLLARRLWREKGGDPELVLTVALWGVPAGILGGRLYHDITSWSEVAHNWYGWIAVWQGGLGIWGGILGGVIGGLIPLRKARVNIPQFLDAAAPGILCAQAIGRVGNYFNQELFGKPSKLPWALEISAAHRPAAFAAFSTFEPTFLYELIFDLALAAALVWLFHHRRLLAPGIFALYVTGYSAFRIFEETQRIDPAHHFLGERLNFWVSCLLTLAGLAWFAWSQSPRRRALASERAAAKPGRATEREQGEAAVGGALRQ